MNFEEATREVESLEFDARLNIASGLRLFLQIAQEEQAVSFLLSELKDREKLQALVSRVLELSHREIDSRYENPWDTPLAVYVWLISMKDFTLARIAAGAASLAPQCWWATKVSSEVLSSIQVSSYGKVVSLSVPDANYPSADFGSNSNTEKVENYSIAA